MEDAYASNHFDVAAGVERLQWLVVLIEFFFERHVLERGYPDDFDLIFDDVGVEQYGAECFVDDVVDEQSDDVLEEVGPLE